MRTLTHLEALCVFHRSPEVDSLVVPELAMCHVAMVTNDLPHMFGWHVFFLGFNKAELALLTVPL